MTTALVLRGAAIAIALASVADPVLTIPRPTPSPLTIAVLDDSGLSAAGRLERALSRDYDATIRRHAAEADAAACPASGQCVIISEGRRPTRLTAGAAVAGAIRVTAATPPGARIRKVDGPHVVDPAAAATLDVELMDGPADVEVFDGDVRVGRSSTTRVEWTPLATGVRALRVRAGSDEVHVGVDVRPTRSRVLVYEPRPSWAGTFVRRALEEDRRFDVHAHARLGSRLAVSAGDPVRLEPEALAGASVIVAGAPESLTGVEVGTLERFARLRGGTVVLLPDRVPTGPVLRLMPQGMKERRETRPGEVRLLTPELASVGDARNPLPALPARPDLPALPELLPTQVSSGLRASEFLTFDTPDVTTTILAHADTAPVVISRALGNGRVVISGALDAWRFREDGAGFARFWTSVIADAADAAGSPLTVTVDTMLPRPGQPVNVTIERRVMDDIPTAIDVEAMLMCEGQPAMPITLWPDGAPGRYRGSFRAPRPGACRVEARASPKREHGPAMSEDEREGGPAGILVSDTARSTRPEEYELIGAVSAHGGVVVSAGDEQVLITRLRASRTSERVSTLVHPMRSPWWIVPFAACLTGEWWLRRRKGLR